jgi:hypothetical protein
MTLMCCIHLQGQRISSEENRWQTGSGFLLGLVINPEDGGDMFLRNVGSLSKDYTVLYPRK